MTLFGRVKSFRRIKTWALLQSVTFRSSSTLLVIAVVFVYKTQGY